MNKIISLGFLLLLVGCTHILPITASNPADNVNEVHVGRYCADGRCGEVVRYIDIEYNAVCWINRTDSEYSESGGISCIPLKELTK